MAFGASLQQAPDDVLSLKTVDLGCGNKKTPGAVGIDQSPHPGVDVVANLDNPPWPVEEHQFERVICKHIVEHVQDLLAFFKEIHRISKDGAVVEVETPHYSCVDSWSDPTHRSHFGSRWHQWITDPQLLSAEGSHFELVESRVVFGRSVHAKITRLVVLIFGIRRWEKHFAFMFPAWYIRTEFRVKK